KIIAGFGKEAVAAFGVASRVEMFVLMVIASLGSVMIIFIGQNFSKNKFSRIFTALNYSGLFSMLWGALVFIILLLFSKNIAGVFTDNAEVIEITRKFFLIVGASYGFQGLVMLGMASFNGINKPYPAAFMAIFRMLILYVPLAWIGAKLLGIAGVFWAGFTANVVVGMVSFMYLFRTLKKIKRNTNP
ncbi:MAG: MATE family efflux transporter, partial [Bacteroidales bacterium]